jgi:mono/diheme cytochrome c family protein
MKMPIRLNGAAVLSVAIATFASSVTAIAADKVDVGKMQYDNYCAVCHGSDGKGNGPMKRNLVAAVPDLTVLAGSNRGVFPFDRVYQTIDGRREISAHGTRDMPIWGRAFNTQSSLYFENYPLADIESNARSRMLALTEYVYRLQSN